MSESEDRLRRLESEIERRLVERFAGLRDEFDRLRLESDRRWAGFLSRFDQDFTGLVPPELFTPPETPPPPERPEGTGLLSIELARSLDDAGNQVEALHRFLDLCRRHASRAALLISKSGSFAVWKATGFSDHGGNDEATRRVTLPMDGGALARVIDGAAFRLAADNEVSTRLGAGDVSAAVLVPIVVKEKVSGAVYADCTTGEAASFDPESIAFLTFLAGLFVDRLAGRKLKPAPALRPLQEFGASIDHREEARRESAPFEAESAPRDSIPPRGGARESFGTKIMSMDQAYSAPEPSPVSPPPRFSEPEFAVSAPSEPAPIPSAPPGASEPGFAIAGTGASRREPEPEVEPEHVLEPEAAVASEPELAYEVEQPIPPAPPPVQEAPAVAPPPPPLAEEPFVPRPSVGARRLAGPLAPAEGDERRDEARRFAKLLVSEIKLYNEKAVLDGRQHGDLYGRLKEDIDRSRQMYDERIPEDVRANSNFFYEELVRILADGRAEALGI
jgi:hypothetical protein